MPINQQFTIGKDAFQIAFQIETGKPNQWDRKRNQRGASDLDLYKNQIDHLENENEKNNPLDWADLETEKINEKKL